MGLYLNFKTAAKTAGISTVWLYEHDAIKQRIVHLRTQQVSKPQMKISSKETAGAASQTAMIAALQKRVREQAAEIERLKRQVEVANPTGCCTSREEESLNDEWQ